MQRKRKGSLMFPNTRGAKSERDSDSASPTCLTPQTLTPQTADAFLRARFAGIHQLSFRRQFITDASSAARRSFFQRLHSTVFGFFLLDRVKLSNCAAYVSAYHYIPLIGVLFALTVALWLFIFSILIFPLLESERSASLETVENRWLVFVSTSATLIAHVGLVIGITFAGYKLMTLVVDCMMDIVLLVDDPDTATETPYYSLLCDLRTIYKGPLLFRALHIVVLLSVFAFACTVAFTRYFGVDWLNADVVVFYLVGTLMLVVWTIVGIRLICASICHPERLVTVWASWLPGSRLFVTFVYFVFSCALIVEVSLSYAVASFCEAMLYTAVIHLLFAFATSLTLYFEKLRKALRVFAFDPNSRRVACQLVFPWIVLVGLSFAYFGPVVALIQIPPLLTLFTSLISFLVKDTVDDNGGPLWHIGLRLYLCNPKHKKNQMPHYRMGFLLRMMIRTLLLLSVAIVVIVGVAASWQNRMEREDTYTTSVTLGSTPECVRVVSATLTADLCPSEVASQLGGEELHQNSLLYEGLCERRWFSLHAGDLAFFSLAAYLPAHSNDFKLLFDFYKKVRIDSSDWEVIQLSKWRPGTMAFIHFYSLSKNVSVVAVRGTDASSAHDFFQNILIFVESTIFQMLAHALPGSRFIPERVIANFVALSSLIDAAIISDASAHYYFRGVEDYVSSLQGQQVVLAGHSLGGVVSKIVGGRLSLPSISFGAPGIVLMQKKFRIPNGVIDAYATNVVASNDVISRLDKLGGAVHNIDCEHTRADVCHSMELHTIRTWTMCPSFRRATRVVGSYALRTQAHHLLFQRCVEWLRRHQ